MKPIKRATFTAILVTILLSCNQNQQTQDNDLLEPKREWYVDTKTEDNNLKSNQSSNPNEESRKKVELLKEAKEGEVLYIDEHPELQNNSKPQNSALELFVDPEGYSKKQKSSIPSSEDFEYSEHWRKEAFKTTKEFLKYYIPKDLPGCKVTHQGFYQPTLVAYIGNQIFRVKVYCEFDCNNGYNNPSIFTAYASYLGNDKWDIQLTDQNFVD